MNKIFKTKLLKLTGTNYAEIYAKAKFMYNAISSKTKRRPYVRSAFFKNEKVFLDHFWQHLMDKNKNDRIRRLKLYPCAIDLIKNSYIEPLEKSDPNDPSKMLHRFSGINGNSQIFYVQIKENLKNNEKYLISVFPN